MAKNKELARRKAARTDARKVRNDARRAVGGLQVKRGGAVSVPGNVVPQREREKMSAILLELAEPFFAAAHTADAKKRLIQLAGMAWNVAVARERGLPNDAPGRHEIPGATELLKALVERKLLLHAGDHRIVETVTFTDRENTMDVNVTSQIVDGKSTDE